MFNKIKRKIVETWWLLYDVAQLTLIVLFAIFLALLAIFISYAIMGWVGFIVCTLFALAMILYIIEEISCCKG